MPLKEAKPETLWQASRAAQKKCRNAETGETDQKALKRVNEAVRRARLLAKTDPAIVELLLNRTMQTVR